MGEGVGDERRRPKPWRTHIVPQGLCLPARLPDLLACPCVSGRPLSATHVTACRRPPHPQLLPPLSTSPPPPTPHPPLTGTGENVAMMADYINLSKFKQIYVVDLCSSLCKQVGGWGGGGGGGVPPGLRRASSRPAVCWGTQAAAPVWAGAGGGT